MSAPRHPPGLGPPGLGPPGLGPGLWPDVDAPPGLGPVPGVRETGRVLTGSPGPSSRRHPAIDLGEGAVMSVTGDTDQKMSEIPEPVDVPMQQLSAGPEMPAPPGMTSVIPQHQQPEQMDVAQQEMVLNVELLSARVLNRFRYHPRARRARCKTFASTETAACLRTVSEARFRTRCWDGAADPERADRLGLER